MTARLAGLFVYPVKSLGGIAVDCRDVDDFGLAQDRRWMIVDPAGQFHTQRSRSRMALARTALDGDCVRLSAPAMPEVSVPRGGGPRRTVAVWGDICQAESCGAEADAWVSAFLGEPCHIVFMPDSTRRPTRGTKDSLGRVSFADAYPFLLLSEASLADLNTRLAAPLPMNRFRPNLVVSGVGAYAEDGWGEFAISDVRLAVTRQCERCVITTIDQDTGAAAREPLRTLASYRRKGDGVAFGVNLAHASSGRLRVGDVVVPAASAG